MSDELKDKKGKNEGMDSPESTAPAILGQSPAEEKSSAENEYDAAWEEAGKQIEGSDEPAKSEEGKVSGEGLPEKAPDKDKKTKPKETTESLLEKEFRDTKAWATRLAMENAELRRTIEAFKRGEASSEDVKNAHQAVAKAQADINAVKERVYEDYPELRELFEPLFERSRSLEQEVYELKTLQNRYKESQEYVNALEYFNAIVKPEVLKVHPDFDDILFKTVEGRRTVNDEYFEWAEKQSPALRFAAMESSDPQDIIMAVSEFKKFKASDEAKEIKLRQEQNKKQKIINAMSIRGGGTPIPAGHKSVDNEDYDAAWEEAGNTLKRQGIV